MNIPRFPFRLSPTLVVAALAALFLIGPGCAPREVGSVRVKSDVYRPIDAPDETLDQPYQPIDDGLPLTRAELAAFESVGELDKDLAQEEKQIVELHFKYFVHANRKTVERFLARSELYLPFIQREFREAGLPEELSYLAFIESGFNPNAVSWAGATGMWQFMPFTGKKYGLSQDRWIDERRDPYKSTRSAITYLKWLNEFFDGDWHLAIAAYNGGEGKISRALTGTDSSTFFEICRKNEMLDGKAKLKQETQQYLPRFLAVTKVMRNLESLGFTRPDPENALDTVAVSVPAGVDLVRFARESKVDWDRFAGLNPAYRRNVSPPHMESTAYIPSLRHGDALAWLSRKDISVYAGWRDYQVRSGDSMGRIASRAGTSTALLRQVNNKKSNSLQVGEYLLVPGSARAARATQEKIAPADVRPVIARGKDGKPATGYKGTHTIGAGETLYSLAIAWGSTLDDICELNDIKPSETLRIGRKLYIPSSRNLLAAAAGPVEVTPQAKPGPSLAAKARGGKGPGSYVTVREGDTLMGIAEANGVTVDDICRANNITSRTRLRIGTELYLVPGKTIRAAAVLSPAQTQAPKPATVVAVTDKRLTIKAGDTLYSIARANNTTVDALAKLNGLRPDDPLRQGQTIRLP